MSIYFYREQKEWLSGEATPLVGILTGRKKDNKVTGNGRLFKELQKEIIKNGGLSVVFTPQNIKDQSIEGYMYLPQKDKWHSAKCPLPHVVYNRVPFQRIEKSKPFQDAYHFFINKQIPFFNPSFLNKYELYQLFSRDSFFHSLLPKTMNINNRASMQAFLEKFGQLYLKPALGSQGKGIYLLSFNQDSGSIELRGQDDIQTYKEFQAFWMKWSPVLLNKLYIAQEAILPSLYNGQRFDFRILAHYVNNHYEVTGVGIRQSKDQDITTHIPNGGIIIPYSLIQTKMHDEFITQVVNQAGRLLTKEIGFFGEFSIDAGVTANGKYVIYEINSKPMKFDEQEIENKRIQSLTQLFLELAGF